MIHNMAQAAAAGRVENGREQFRLERLGILAQFRLLQQPGQLALFFQGQQSGPNSGIALPVRSGLNRRNVLRNKRAVSSARSE